MQQKQLITAAAALLLTLSLTGCPAEAPATESKRAESSTSAAASGTAAGSTAESTSAASGAAAGSTAESTSAAQSPQLDMAQIQAEIDSKKLEDFVPSSEPTLYVKLTVKDFGELVVRLRPDLAPISAENFQSLVARGYYNGTIFHRVFPGFMIQGGAGEESLPPIKGEFAANGVQNPLLHIRGVLSMARTKVNDSATSQFFLMHADTSSLDGQYAAFGYIVAGLDTVDRVCQIDLETNPYSGERSVPTQNVLIESAVFVQPK